MRCRHARALDLLLGLVLLAPIHASDIFCPFALYSFSRRIRSLDDPRHEDARLHVSTCALSLSAGLQHEQAWKMRGMQEEEWTPSARLVTRFPNTSHFPLCS